MLIKIYSLQIIASGKNVNSTILPDRQELASDTLLQVRCLTREFCFPVKAEEVQKKVQLF